MRKTLRINIAFNLKRFAHRTIHGICLPFIMTELEMRFRTYWLLLIPRFRRIRSSTPFGVQIILVMYKRQPFLKYTRNVAHFKRERTTWNYIWGVHNCGLNFFPLPPSPQPSEASIVSKNKIRPYQSFVPFYYIIDRQGWNLWVIKKPCLSPYKLHPWRPDIYESI